MNAETEATAVALSPKRTSLVAKIAERYSMEPAKLLDTLKATAFKTEKPATNEQMAALLVVADQYNLNPFTRELFAFVDQRSGAIVPVVSVDGWARIINEHPEFDGVQFVFADDGSACTCVMFRKDRSHPTTVTEFLKECKRNTGPWGSHPLRMLRHKALIQCARIAFGFAGIYDDDEAARIVDANKPTRKPEPVSASAQRVRSRLNGGADVSDAAVVERDDKTAEMFPEPEPQEPTPTNDGRTLAALVLELKDAPDADMAALIVDQARHLPPDHQAQLSALYQTLWPTE